MTARAVDDVLGRGHLDGVLKRHPLLEEGPLIIFLGGRALGWFLTQRQPALLRLDLQKGP